MVGFDCFVGETGAIESMDEVAVAPTAAAVLACEQAMTRHQVYFQFDAHQDKKI